MGNRVYLELHGSAPPASGKEHEDAVASLAANNGLPLFWLALLRNEHLGPAWESGVRTMFADPEADAVEPIRLDWPDARTNLAAARAAAETRLPDLFPGLRDWEAGLLAVAGQGQAQEVRLHLAEHANFYDSADAFMARLRDMVRLWHGAEPPTMPHTEDAGSDLTGFVSLTDEPFPAALPSWEPTQPAPEPPVPATDVLPAPAGTGQPAATRGVAMLVSALAIGLALLGAAYLGWGGLR